MSSSMSALEKKTFLITGASSGFGLALARLAISEGHTVVATSRDPERTPALVSEITSVQPAGRGRWLKLDTTDLRCGDIITSLEVQGTHIDVLFNSAGIVIPGPVESFPEEEVRKAMEMNFYGPWRLIMAAVPHMRKRRSGMVVNITSGSGSDSSNSLGVYSASKAALDGLTKALYKEMSPFGVRVLLVSLGGVDTPIPGTAASLALRNLQQDYAGNTSEHFVDTLTSGIFDIQGDHLKAVQATYELIIG